MNPQEAYSFSVSGYEGHEAEVLDLRNRNRAAPCAGSYMDWRYRGEEGAYDPLIYWAHSDEGEPVGMAGVIFRPYWIGDERRYFAVLGDVSLDEGLRGKGIGKRMLEYMTQHLRATHGQTVNGRDGVACCFVIPTETLGSCLLSCGWEDSQAFVWYLWVIDPTYKLEEWIGAKALPPLVREIPRKITGLRIGAGKGPELDAEPVGQVDEAFDRFWNELAKDDLILRDRCAASLRWRYETHPDRPYEFRKIMQKGTMVGYVVCDRDEHGNCWVNDLLALRTELVPSVVRAFLREEWKNGRTRVVRLKLSRNHPYESELLRCGFLRRSYQDSYQVCWLGGNAAKGGKNWFLSSGDKDT